MSKKPIIVFEGIEGSGKSTHIKNVCLYLKRNKKKFISFREPGGSKNSEIIRKLILNKKSNFNNKTDLFLYLASRNENYEKIIKNNFRKKIILIDRFIDSTIAYQHFGMKIDKKIINLLNSFILKKIKPDFTFISIVNKKNLISRLKARKNKNRYDNFNYSFYKKVQKGYLDISNNKKTYMIINSNLNININKNKIINKIKDLIK